MMTSLHVIRGLGTPQSKILATPLQQRISPCLSNKRFDQIREHCTKIASLIIKVLFNPGA